MLKNWFQRYKNWIKPPVIPGDSEQTRITALLNRIFLMFIYILGIFLFVGPFIFQVWYATWIAFAVLVLAWQAMRAVARRGYIHRFSMGLVMVLWILTTGLVHTSGGLENSPHAFSYATVVLIAGMLLGGPGGLIATMMSIASLALVVFLSETGRLPPNIDDHSQIDELLITSANLLMVALFMFLSWRSQREASEKEITLARKAIAANNYKTDLVARVSHELRTPLGAVIGLTDMLRSGVVGPVPPEHDKLLQKIMYNGDYLQHLVAELLEQSQIASGQLTIRYARFSPQELAARIAATLEPLARQKGLALKLEGADQLPDSLLGDAERLEEVFTNLLGNAIKYTDQGSIITRASLPDSDHWQVEIIDTGIGIPAEALDSIFEPFRQLGNTTTERKQGGVGLGLAIAKQLTEMMGGKIYVASTLGEGTTFTVRFPIESTQRRLYETTGLDR